MRDHTESFLSRDYPINNQLNIQSYIIIIKIGKRKTCKETKKNCLLFVPRVNYYPEHPALIIWTYFFLVRRLHFCFPETENSSL